MERPENVLQQPPSPQPNPNQSIYETSNPVFVNLMSIMARIDPLYYEFQRLHIEAAAARHTNPNAFFSPDLLVVNESSGFVSGYYGILGTLQNIDLSHTESVQHSKFRIFDSIRTCESYFANFNQKYQAAPQIIRIIANMSIVFTEIKQELGRLGLYDVPRFDLTQEAPNANHSVQSRTRGDDAPEGERSTFRKRLQ